VRRLLLLGMRRRPGRFLRTCMWTATETTSPSARQNLGSGALNGGIRDGAVVGAASTFFPDYSPGRHLPVAQTPAAPNTLVLGQRFRWLSGQYWIDAATPLLSRPPREGGARVMSSHRVINADN